MLEEARVVGSVGVGVGEYRGEDDSGFVDAEMEFPPSLDSTSSVLHSGPFAFFEDRQAAVVDDQVDRTRTDPNSKRA